MSGHSKWSTIKRAKGVADVKKGKTFTKLANAITIVVRTTGSGDPDSNPRLRTVLEEAKEVNMPKENIQRAIDKGLGKLPGQTIEEATYEGFGPGKVAFIVECVTDNKLRTLQEMKNLFTRGGGALAGQGAVSYMFDKKGEIRVKRKGERGKDEEMLELMDSGAEDVEDFDSEDESCFLIYSDSAKLTEVTKTINTMGYIVQSSELTMKPNVLMKIEDSETAKKVLDFTDNLESSDDVQKVYANFDISEEVIVI